jgi:hypothetical protein
MLYEDKQEKLKKIKKWHIKFIIKIGLNKSVVMLTSQENNDTQNIICGSNSQNKAYIFLY